MKQAIQKIILTLLTAFVEKERDEIKTRQSEGIAVAKKNERLGEILQAVERKEITAVQFME